MNINLPKILKTKVTRENIVLVGILIILLAIPLTVVLLGIRQELRKRAAGENGAILINNGAETTNSRNVTLTLTAPTQQAFLKPNFKVPQAYATDGCENCVGGTTKLYSSSVWDLNGNGKVDNCSEACLAFFGPDCTQAGCGNPGSTDPAICCWCMNTAGTYYCNGTPVPTPTPRPPTPTPSPRPPTPTPTPASTCYDSDGGRNYYLKGELTGGNNTCAGGVCYDSCYNGQTYGSLGRAVSEWYCENNIAKRETVNCPSGSCDNGACTGITPTPTPTIPPRQTPTPKPTPSVIPSNCDAACGSRGFASGYCDQAAVYPGETLCESGETNIGWTQDCYVPSGTLGINRGCCCRPAAPTPTPVPLVTEINVSNYGNFSAAQTKSWPVSATSWTIPWTLTEGDGLKTVYAKFRWSDGTWTSPVSDTITLQTTGPTPTSTPTPTQPPTPTPTLPPGVTPTPTPTTPPPTPTPTPRPPTPTPTPTPPAGCWGLCLLDSQCSSGLDCQWVGILRRCINSKCPSETDCTCPIPTPTPTPTPTPGGPTPTPTPTTPPGAPTPTPTPSPGGYLKLDLLKVWFWKQEKALGRGHEGAVLLALKQGGNVVLEKAVQLDANGEARNVELPGVSAGTYNAFVYEAGYLTKKLSNVTLQQTGNTLDFTRGGTEYFLVGDFNGDQEVNILDFSIFVKSYGKSGEE